MSVAKKVLLGLGGAAVMAAGIAGTANAQVVAAGPGACDAYAHEYAAVNAPQFGFGGYDTAYRHAYNECISGGPDFVGAGAYAVGSALHAGTSVAGSALYAGTSVVGTALSLPGAILGGTTAALAPTSPITPEIDFTKPRVEIKNYRGTYEVPVQ
jgi:hypothetical protein